MVMPIEAMTPEQWQRIVMEGDPLDYLSTPENWRILLSKGIDPLGHLTPVEWRMCALQDMDNRHATLFLDGIDAMDWDQLRHAAGSASDIPEWFRALLTTDELASIAVWNHLFDILCEQSIVYDATVASMPFLLRFLSSHDHVHREMTLTFLTFMVRVTAEESTSDEVSTFEQVQAAFAQMGRDFAAERQQRRIWETEIRHLIIEALPTIRLLLDDPDVNVQEAAHIFFDTLKTQDTA